MYNSVQKLDSLTPTKSEGSEIYPFELNKLIVRNQDVLLSEDEVSKNIQAAAKGTGVRIIPNNRKVNTVLESHQVNVRAKVDPIF